MHYSTQTSHIYLLQAVFLLNSLATCLAILAVRAARRATLHAALRAAGLATLVGPTARRVILAAAVATTVASHGLRYTGQNWQEHIQIDHGCIMRAPQCGSLASTKLEAPLQR